MAGAIPPAPGSLPHAGAPGQPATLPGNPGGRPSPVTPAIDTTAQIMNAAAAAHHIPAWLLWGIFGAESSYGKTGNWFGLIAVPRSTDGPNGSPTFHGDANIAAATIAGLISKNHGDLNKALDQYSGGGYAGLARQHKVGTTSSAWVHYLAQHAPLKIDIPTNWFQDFAAGKTGDAVAGTLKALATPAEILAYVVTHLADPHFWLRVLEVVGGFVALMIALRELVGGPDVSAVVPGPAGVAARALHSSARETAAQPRYQRQINLRGRNNG